MQYVGKTWYNHMKLIQNEGRSTRIIGLCRNLAKASNRLGWLHWIVTYPVNKVIRVLNNWGKKVTRVHEDKTSNRLGWLLWIVTYPVNKVIWVLNNWGKKVTRVHEDKASNRLGWLLWIVTYPVN